MELRAENIIRIKSNVFSTKTDDKIVILNYNTGMYFGLDEIGSEYWSLIEKNNTVGEIVNDIINKYEVSKDKVQNDLNILVNDFIEKDLVQVN